MLYFNIRKLSWCCNMQKLRGELDKLLKKKIEDPSINISEEGKGVVDAVVELLHSRNVQY